jgi:hypothetical protein
MDPQIAQNNQAVSMKLASIYRWHLLGAMAQLAFAVAIIVTTNSIFALPIVLLASCDMISIAIKAGNAELRFYEFRTNGNVKTMTIRNGLGFF